MSLNSLPTVFVPGLFCSPRLYADQLAALWTMGPVTVADHRRDASLAAIAERLLADAPPRFALVGLSMGGYVAFEVRRQAPDRVARLALLSTSARPDTPEQADKRRAQISAAEAGRFAEVVDKAFPMLVAPSRRDDEHLQGTVKAMAEDTGPQAFVRQQTAIMGRVDSRPSLASIGCPALVLAGSDDQLIDPSNADEMAAAIPRSYRVDISGCGHLASLEKPAEVTQALLAFWHQAYQADS
jgi:pimeloyl-ACP methyl ester carboxylesterase